MKYEIISRRTTTELVSAVSVYLAALWQLYGEMRFADGHYHQVLTKDED